MASFQILSNASFNAPLDAVNSKQTYNKPSSNALSKEDSIIRGKINKNNYLLNAGNSIIRGLTHKHTL
jgi:hypothetical protein